MVPLLADCGSCREPPSQGLPTPPGRCRCPTTCREPALAASAPTKVPTWAEACRPAAGQASRWSCRGAPERTTDPSRRPAWSASGRWSSRAASPCVQGLHAVGGTPSGATRAGSRAARSSEQPETDRAPTAGPPHAGGPSSSEVSTALDSPSTPLQRSAAAQDWTGMQWMGMPKRPPQTRKADMQREAAQPCFAPANPAKAPCRGRQPRFQQWE